MDIRTMMSNYIPLFHMNTITYPCSNLTTIFHVFCYEKIEWNNLKHNFQEGEYMDDTKS